MSLLEILSTIGYWAQETLYSFFSFFDNYFPVQQFFSAFEKKYNFITNVVEDKVNQEKVCKAREKIRQEVTKEVRQEVT